MRTSLVVISAALALTACKKTGEGEYQVQTPTISVGTDTHTVHTPTIGTKTDTVNVPVVGTRKDTIIVDKPVVGIKKATITRPTVKKP
jgi:hypothetical protein